MHVYRVETPPGYDEDGNPVFELWHLPFAGDEGFSMNYCILSSDLVFPKTLIGFSDKRKILEKHSLVSFLGRYVWSKKLIDTLLSIGDFEYSFLNIHIFDLELYEWACNNVPQMQPDFADANTNYGYFRLMRNESTLDCFDFEKSQYSPPRRSGGAPRKITKLVFKKRDFPPLFFDKTTKQMYLSQEAKDALEANDIYLPLTEIEVS